MRSKRKKVIGRILALVVVFGHVVSSASAARRDSQDQQSLAEASQPPSLARKRQCLEAEMQKWQQEGKDLHPIAEVLQEFPPLFMQQKYADAEQVVDRAIKVAGATCPDQPASAASGAQASPAAEPPVSLQQKMQHVQALVQQKQEEEADLQPFAEVMQGFPPLIQQHKFTEAEALLDRALSVLAAIRSTAPPIVGPPLIAYESRDPDGHQQLFVVHPDGTGTTRLTEEGNTNSFPAWSPDGRRIAFASDRSSSLQIWTMRADGSNPRQLTTEGENGAPAWAPDGKSLAFESNRTGHHEVWVMDSDGSRQQQLTKTNSTVDNSGPTWSPDGHRIAFDATQGGHSTIWVMNQDGDQLTRLTTSSGTPPDSNAPAWSPDGTKIVFSSARGHGGGNVWVMNADGSNRRQLTNQPADANCGEPVWAGDSQHVLFECNSLGKEGVATWIMDADGSNQKVLINNVHVRARPAWQPVAGTKWGSDLKPPQ